jgi:flagellar biosynthesis/type III secretory pathway protein FliH
MSTSYNGLNSGAQSEIEAFIYPDTAAGAAASAAPAEANEEPEQAPPPKVAELPRISEAEISRLVSEAHAQGMAEGIRRTEARFADELAKERERTSEAIRNFQEQCKEYFSKVELELVHLSLAIAAKILHRESQIDRMVVAGLVKVMLEKLHQNTKVVVRVRPEDEKSWQQYFHDNKALQVIADSTLEPKACVLESEVGVANLGLDSQLKEVEQGFFDLLAQKPGTK